MHATTLQVVTEEAPPLQYIVNDQIQGVSTNIVREVLKEAGFDAEFHVYPWARAYNVALKERNTLIYSTLRTAEREKLFHWVGVIGEFKMGFVMLDHHAQTPVNSLEDLKQFKIGAMRDDFTHNYIVAKGFKEQEHFLLRSNLKELIQLLYSNRIDTYMTDAYLTQDLIKIYGYDETRLQMRYLVKDLETDVYLAANINTPLAIVGKLQKALEKVKAMPQFKDGFQRLDN